MLPFFKEISYPLGVFGFVILTYLVIVGSSNAVNLTDGLDGLAIMPVVMVGSALGVFAYVTGSSVYSKYLFFPHIPGSGELLIFCSAMAGAGLAFLWFNTHPAQVFMGDVGALALGARAGHHRGDRAPGNRAGHHGWHLRGRGAVGDGAGDVVQVHQEAIRRGPAHPQDGAAAPPFREERLERDAGRRAFLDHHHAAVPGGPVHPEVALGTWPCCNSTINTCSSSGLGASGLAMARWCALAGAHVTVADTRDAPPQLEPCAASSRQRGLWRGLFGGPGRRSTRSRRVQEPRPRAGRRGARAGSRAPAPGCGPGAK